MSLNILNNLHTHFYKFEFKLYIAFKIFLKNLSPRVRLLFSLLLDKCINL